jgi:apolipoprotein N-acyltransferase
MIAMIQIVFKPLLSYMSRWKSFFLGLAFPLGFAPFHIPSVLYLSLLFFIRILLQSKSLFRDGFLYGLGLALVGVSWIYNSIHQYGHLHCIIALFATLLFVMYVALFYGLFNLIYCWFRQKTPLIILPLVTAAIWTLCEWIRSTLFGGFPWLIIGFSVIETPLQNLLPWFGLYAPGFILILSLACFAQFENRLLAIAGTLLFLFPQTMTLHFPNAPHRSISVAMIQGNVKMQDKWNEDVFWKLFHYYFHEIVSLLEPYQTIILPEAAISVPSSFLHHELELLNKLSKEKNTALLLGIPQPSTSDQWNYHNGILGLGQAQGTYFKQQLVPFGEYIPHIFQHILTFLKVPMVTTIPGEHMQKPIHTFDHPIASLICYELAYPEILRQQLPSAQWIVSQSDDGWFGHSLALYQHLQMAQTLSFMSHRDQVFVNNNGLSSLINASGQVIAQIPAWQRNHLQGHIHEHSETTPWMRWGDRLALTLILSIFLLNFSVQLFLTILKKFKLTKPAIAQ